METTFKYTKQFDSEYEYSGNDLGAICLQDTTVFKIWAPFAESVELCLYEEGGTAKELPIHSIPKACEKYLMQREAKGVFRLDFDKNLHGTWYDYLISTNGETVRTADPNAYACSCNGCRSMVVDLTKTNPDGFAEDEAPSKPTENIIYELHIKDFSSDENSGIPKEFRGKYKAFTVEGTELEISAAKKLKVPTGIEYLKKLGVTHVHLLPFFDFGWLDENGEDTQFNWGYDPVNYNVPEGSFATDVSDGTVRIRECKEMIMALHKAGIRVVMDVVYNHANEADCWLERTAPGYFCRRNEDGSLANGSACGSDLAVGRAMVDNYIVNSVLYWAKEYHIDGFRFDLMGLLTTEVMNRVQKSLNEAFGDGEKFVYGEPWRANTSPMESDTHAALKDNIDKLDTQIAVFSDDTRDTIKGAVFYPKVPGFVNGGRNQEDNILDAVSGWRENVDGFHPKACSQIINYVSAHDNHTLWDKLLYTMREGEIKKEEYLEPARDLIKVNKLAALIYFTCQGNIFFQAGEEFGRTKFGDENSFRSEVEINMLRWEQTARFEELVEYYRGLIALRKKLPGLYDKSERSFERISGQTIHREKVVSFFVSNEDEKKESKWDQLLIAYNASDTSYLMELPDGNWEILADEKEADTEKAVKERVAVLAHSGNILGRAKS